MTPLFVLTFPEGRKSPDQMCYMAESLEELCPWALVVQAEAKGMVKSAAISPKAVKGQPQPFGLVVQGKSQIRQTAFGIPEPLTKLSDPTPAPLHGLPALAKQLQP